MCIFSLALRAAICPVLIWILAAGSEGLPNLLNVRTCIRPDGILGGQEVDDGRHRFMAAVVTFDESGKMQLRCGATLITPNHVLLAAHCFHAKAGKRVIKIDSSLSVIVGVADLNYAEDFGAILPISRVRIHPAYDPKAAGPWGDIAVARLSDPEGLVTEAINDNCKADVVMLPANGADISLQSGQTIEALGWGRTESERSSDKLKRVDLVYVAHDDCIKSRPQLPNITFCAIANEGKDTCSRDSGGPVVIPESARNDPLGGPVYFQVGVTHGGAKRCGSKTAKPSVYVSVAHYLNWIKKTVNELSFGRK